MGWHRADKKVQIVTKVTIVTIVTIVKIVTIVTIVTIGPVVKQKRKKKPMTPHLAPREHGGQGEVVAALAPERPHLNDACMRRPTGGSVMSQVTG